MKLFIRCGIHSPGREGKKTQTEAAGGDGGERESWSFTNRLQIPVVSRACTFYTFYFPPKVREIQLSQALNAFARENQGKSWSTLLSNLFPSKDHHTNRNLKTCPNQLPLCALFGFFESFLDAVLSDV